MTAKVLLVDADVSGRQMLVDLLKRNGYQVHTASSGHAALTDYAGFLSPLALIEMDVPDMSVWELLGG